VHWFKPKVKSLSLIAGTFGKAERKSTKLKDASKDAIDSATEDDNGNDAMNLEPAYCVQNLLDLAINADGSSQNDINLGTGNFRITSYHSNAYCVAVYVPHIFHQFQNPTLRAMN
jgi:hypothetical protein